MYLWRAHNNVNARLSGKTASEDPQYPKVQFPPGFLCKDCNVDSDQERDDQAVQKYLLEYYSNIRPRDTDAEEAE